MTQDFQRLQAFIHLWFYNSSCTKSTVFLCSFASTRNDTATLPAPCFPLSYSALLNTLLWKTESEYSSLPVNCRKLPWYQRAPWGASHEQAEPSTNLMGQCCHHASQVINWMQPNYQHAFPYILHCFYSGKTSFGFVFFISKPYCFLSMKFL